MNKTTVYALLLAIFTFSTHFAYADADYEKIKKAFQANYGITFGPMKSYVHTYESFSGPRGGYSESLYYDANRKECLRRESGSPVHDWLESDSSCIYLISSGGLQKNDKIEYLNNFPSDVQIQFANLSVQEQDGVFYCAVKWSSTEYRGSERHDFNLTVTVHPSYCLERLK